MWGPGIDQVGWGEGMNESERLTGLNSGERCGTSDRVERSDVMQEGPVDCWKCSLYFMEKCLQRS